MGKIDSIVQHAPVRRISHHATLLLCFGIATLLLWQSQNIISWLPHHSTQALSPYLTFPRPDDPFQFMPCTADSILPELDDKNAARTWAARFDPEPAHWSWGNATRGSEHRGIYLCGYLDVSLDFTNASDPRIVRLAVSKYQVSGLARAGSTGTGRKSERTIVLNPGGPGGSGTNYLWRTAEQASERFSEGRFDVLGWDPRGVNASLPSISCFPFDADRDRYSLLANQYRSVSPSPLAHLRVADALNNATFAACKEKYGDIPRFVGTGFVARDLEEIRKALNEPELTGYLVSYGTGIGQTYANMFPNSVGRLILDGTEYVRDHRLLGGFGWTALDNGTNTWHDGFLGECLAAGPNHCALAKLSKNVTIDDLQARLSGLLDALLESPFPAYNSHSGPSLITYSSLVDSFYMAMYNPTTWPALAEGLYQLEQGNATLIAQMLDRSEWEFDPSLPCKARNRKPSSEELSFLVICADSHDAPQPPFSSSDPDGLQWYSSLWKNMTTQSWIAGDSRFYDIFPCRHYTPTFGSAVGVYRGDLNHTLAHPVLLVAETYDPATPLRNGRRLLEEMGRNARLVVHHGYGHSSRDRSECTERLVREYILYGRIPEERETECFADEKPYRYGIEQSRVGEGDYGKEMLRVWREGMRELRESGPGLFRH